MGGVLSQAEKKHILPHLQGFNPDALSTIIWDTINLVGVDDQQECFGIQFDEPEANNIEETNDKEEEENVNTEKKTKEQMVTFWDDEMVQCLPFPIFIDVLTYVGEETIKEYEAKYNLEEENEITAGVNKLKLALEYLQGTSHSMKRSETAAEYRSKIEGKSSGSGVSKRTMIEEVRERRGTTQVYSAGTSEREEKKEGRQTRGMEGMVNRLPELQKRYGTAGSTSSKAMRRATLKLQSLSLFSRSIQPDEQNNEDQQ